MFPPRAADGQSSLHPNDAQTVGRFSWLQRSAVRTWRNPMRYVDGFLLAVPKRKLPIYRRIAQRAGRLWREHGALEYRECIGDDLKVTFGTSFARTARLKAGETAVFSWIVYKSRAHRDRVNAKLMNDVRMQKLMKNPMPFDMKRMSYGGFTVLVDL
jgi:uncharacterized protein YbaA (DUF1428 family)